jgi:DNA-binding MarR family transcriptional regulator
MNDETDSTTLLSLIVADIFELAGHFRGEGETIAAAVGQTQARWQVMSAASSGPLTVPQIARRLGVTRQNVQRIADLLVSENWARFEENPDHRGSPHLVLNKRGQSAVAELSKAARGFHAELAGRLADTDIGTVHRGLRRLLEAVSEHQYESKEPRK